MRVQHTNSTARRLSLILPLAVLVASCAGRTPKTTAADPARIDVSQLWVDPRDIETRDLFHGAGGAALAPNPSIAYQLVAVDDSGYSPGYEVRDRQGTEWSVKLGIEAQPEIVASRVLWAIGFHQPPTYLLTDWQLEDKQGGPQAVARFRRESEDRKVVSDWSWYENPFVTTKPFRGLVVANLILNNWDLKTSNNKVYTIAARGKEPRRLYVVRDLGASLGKTTFPAILQWTPFRAMAQGSRNDIDDFEQQGFVKGVEGQRVKFHYRGTNGALVETLTVDDVVWTCRMMARLSDRQWADAFRAAGYDRAVGQRYAAKLKTKIREGLALDRSQAHSWRSATTGSTRIARLAGR
jgi:hypothetical protein